MILESRWRRVETIPSWATWRDARNVPCRESHRVGFKHKKCWLIWNDWLIMVLNYIYTYVLYIYYLFMCIYIICIYVPYIYMWICDWTIKHGGLGYGKYWWTCRYVLWKVVRFWMDHGTTPDKLSCLFGWWFGTFLIFPYIGNNHLNWLIFFRGVKTTNQL